MRIEHLRDKLLDLLLPQACAGCRRDLEAALPLCARCLRNIKALSPENTCRRCVSRVPPGRSHCRPCRRQLFAVDAVRAAFAYEKPVSDLLYLFKYRRNIATGKMLAGWMAGLYPRAANFRGIDAIVPVPLHPQRLRERGFNQAEVLAEELARVARIPMLSCLERTRNTLPQWGLGKPDRAKNLAGAFSISAGAPSLKGNSILLIDDVCTTGGTLEACARALQEAGAARIQAYVLARD